MHFKSPLNDSNSHSDLQLNKASCPQIYTCGVDPALWFNGTQVKTRRRNLRQHFKGKIKTEREKGRKHYTGQKYQV